MKSLVVQRARLGDLLQSLPLIRALSDAGESVTLLVSEDMMEAARLVHPGGNVFGFPGKGHLLELASGSPMKAAGTIARFLENFRTVPYDRLFQLNHDGTGALLGKLLPAREKRGFFSLHDRILPGEEERKKLSGWPAYLVASARGVRAVNRIHLSDVWIGFGFSGSEGEREDFSRDPVPGPGPVGLVLSGRSVYRELVLEDVALLVDRIQRFTGRPVVLLGRPDEREKARVLTRLISGPVVNRVGETSLAQLWAEVASLSLLVSPDTATLHLSASLKVPSIGLFFSNAQPHETGAYLPGCLAVTPDLECHPCAGEGSGCTQMECRSLLDPEYLARLAERFLTGSALPEPPAGLRVWRSRRESGFLSYRPTHACAATREDVLGILFRRFYLRILDREVVLPSLEEECRPFAGQGWPSLLSGDHLVQGASLASRQWGDHPLDPLEKRRVLEEIPLLWPLFLLTEDVEGGQGKRDVQRQAFALLSEETLGARSLLMDQGKKEKERSFSTKNTRTGREVGHGV
jgi:ADP-heptose:LPS heptosyltransferase|uniref:Putative heptosyltransferase family protein n=1 Tax=Leptospirillum sp. Group II '5-way CG' TaxID=419541 RepID=B6AKI3_9BACT|nr:MAG: Putative heptosyltransferase family protein [Leptospirillum sp. Group II '5-way CG']